MGHEQPGRRRGCRSNATHQPAAGAISKVYGFGYSQTGGYLNTYTNAIHKLGDADSGAPVYDGYFIAVAGGGFVGLTRSTSASRSRRSAIRAARPATSACRSSARCRCRTSCRDRRPAAGQRHAGGPVPALRDGGHGPRIAGRAELLGAPGRHGQGRAPGAAGGLQRGPAQPLPDQHRLRRDPAEPRPLGRGTASPRRAPN